MDFQLSREQRDLVAVTRAFAEARFGPAAFTWEERGAFPREYLSLLADQGLAGIALPSEDGGQGGTLLDAVLVIETVAQVCPTAGDCVQALNFGAIQQIARHGSHDLKARFLAPALRGEKVVSIGMTEPEAGSAVTDLRARARLEGDQVVLRGQKIFTTNGEHADLFVVWVKFGESSRSAGAVVVERGAPGFTVDGSHSFMSGERYGMLYFDDCRVPAANVLVAEDGFRRMLSVFNVERLGNASRSLALGQAAFDRAVAYVKERRQFGRRLAEFQGLQWRFAEMKLKLDGARLLLYRAAANADAGLPSELETSLAKLACNRAGFEVADAALQVFGGYGYADESPLNYIFRRTRGWMIAGGSIEQLLNRVAGEVFGEHFSQRPPRPAEPTDD
ncbi:MAG TPA: acyl-CoA dehydrogenase family protein [Thermomicrobiaceae bacterium]|nr:acyl-CoA dehydrogenase family protein [Thermomicrobiaceae bacterium]